MALDITEGKLFPEGNLGEGQRADQEIVHAQDQKSQLLVDASAVTGKLGRWYGGGEELLIY